MASEQDTSVLQVLVDENAKARLLLSSGLAMFIDPSTGWSQSFELKEGFVHVDYHNTTGHIRISNIKTSPETSIVFRSLQEELDEPRTILHTTPPIGSEHLPHATQEILRDLVKYFKKDLVIASPPVSSQSVDNTIDDDYGPVTFPTATLQQLPKVDPSAIPPLPYSPLRFASRFRAKGTGESAIPSSAALSSSSLASTSSPSSSTFWVVARVVDHGLGTPSTCFQVNSMSSISKGLTVRLRLYPSFKALQTKLTASNPLVPLLPSNWRRDQRVLQTELDLWLLDAQRLEPRHPALDSFLRETNDTFTPVQVGSSGSYFSIWGSFMEAARYVPLALPNPSPKPITLLVGPTGSSKSSFLNHIFGFPVCDPIGTAPEGLSATIFETLPPAAFATLASFPSYWTHPTQINMSTYPEGTQIISVDNHKLQEPIHRLESSWKKGAAFLVLDHLQTLDRYKLGPPLLFSALRFRTCIISEAVLDPIRLEFEVAKSNIFIELHHFDQLTPAPEPTAPPFTSSTHGPNDVPPPTPLLIIPAASLWTKLLEVALLRQRISRWMYFAKLDALHRAAVDHVLLELVELLSFNKDTLQFSTRLMGWVDQATNAISGELDLSLLLALMKPLINLLPTPRSPSIVLFLTTELIPEEAQDAISNTFRIHDILQPSAHVLLTQDTTTSTLSTSQLSLSISSSPAAVYNHLIPTEDRDLLLMSLTPSKSNGK